MLRGAWFKPNYIVSQALGGGRSDVLGAPQARLKRLLAGSGSGLWALLSLSSLWLVNASCSTGSGLDGDWDTLPMTTSSATTDDATTETDGDEETSVDSSEETADDTDATSATSTTSTTGTTTPDQSSDTAGDSSDPNSDSTTATSTTTDATDDTQGTSMTSSSTTTTETHDTGGDVPAWKIDDFEDGDGQILTVDMRSGSWYTFNDGKGGTQKPAPGKAIVATQGTGDGNSTMFVETSGSGFKDWGAGLGVDLRSPGDTKQIYDGSAYDGITFIARAFEPYPTATLRVLVETAGVLPVAEGGTCDTPADSTSEECLNTHYVLIELTSSWQSFTVEFSKLAQEPGWGKKVAFKSSELTGLQFVVDQEAGFHFAMDNFAFYPGP